MSRQPAIKARSAQDAIRWADAYRGMTGEVSATVDPEVLAQVMTATPNTWIPVELDRHMVNAIYEVHGPEGAARCWREFMQTHVDSPLLKGILSMSIRLFGLSPAGILRFTPKVWKHNYRDFCEVESEEIDEGHVSVTFHDVHPEVFAVPAYAVCVRSVFAGLCDVVGGAEVEMSEDAASLRWNMTVKW